MAGKACLTYENLRKRGYQLSSRCYLSAKVAEDNFHLFLHSVVTSQLWKMFFSMVEMSWVPKITIDLLRCCCVVRGCQSEMVKNYSNMHLVNGLEGKEFQMFWGSNKFHPENNLNCKLLFKFWCKSYPVNDLKLYFIL